MPSFALRPLPVPLPPLQQPPPGSTTIVVDEADAYRYPCRRCLRDAEPGERIVLLSYDPFDAGAESPYRQPGPIFVHADPCSFEAPRRLPDQLTRRMLSVRAFDATHVMLGGVVVHGQELEETAERLLANGAVSYLHVHNAGPGCFATRIDRAA